MTTIKLHDIVAIRKGVKSRTYGEFTNLHKQSKPDLYNGMHKEFEPIDEDEGETFPPESKKVQLVAEDVLKQVAALRTEFYDVEMTQEVGNQAANADVVVDGKIIMAGVPVTMLISLEKDLKDVLTFISELPTLDEAKDWEQDPNGKLYRTQPTRTHKTKKVQKPIVLYPATPEHPAQTQMTSDDIIIGHWVTKYTSGALPVPRRDELVERLNKLRDAVKQARSRANAQTEVERQQIGAALFGYILG